LVILAGEPLFLGEARLGEAALTAIGLLEPFLVGVFFFVGMV
jgi:hypothetical protein